MSDYSSIFGETLLSKKGEVSVSSLDGKYVGVYFSAHWCAPCRQFTPVLRKVYLNLQKQNVPFEIVFCSKDNDIKGFEEYYGSMPWLAIPFDNNEVKENLNNLFAVSGIPRLVMLSPDGVINPQAKADVEENPAGFPWKEPTPLERIAPYITKKGVALGAAAVENKVYGMYFSAHWCNPCKKFTPQLIETYNKLQAEGKPFEVIFCSMDTDPAEYAEYYGTMPWCTIGFECPVLKKLKEQMGVEGIPYFVLFDAEGNLITADGRSAVESQGAEGYPWMPAALKDLNLEPDDINAKACFVAFMDKDCCSAEKKESVIADLSTIAEQYRNVLSFFYVKEEGDVSNQIRGMIQADTCPLMSIVDIPDNGGYYLPEKNEMTVENITEFINAFVNKTLERKQMVVLIVCSTYIVVNNKQITKLQ